MTKKASIPVFNAKGTHVIANVYPRYACQLVISKKAVWRRGRNSIRQLMPYPILLVFQKVGMRYSVAETMQRLKQCFPNDPYACHKASGSIGGASHSGVIVLEGNEWVRMR